MQTTSPKISVILPVYNGGNYLLPAVMSIIEQAFTDWELIIIDDGSSDDAVTHLYALNEPRLKIFSDGVNKGLANRLNQAVSLSSGSYIARMDADDFCFPDRFEKQVKFLDQHPEVDLLSGAVVAFNSKTMKVIGLLPHREFHESIIGQLWSGMYMPHPTWMGRAEWFRRFHYRIPEVKRSEDQELLLRACTASRFHSIPDVLLAYRQNDFDFRKTFIARKSLLNAQLYIFISRRKFFCLAKAIFIFGIKLFVDAIAAIPGLRNVFFRRMSYAVPEHVRTTFNLLKTRL